MASVLYVADRGMPSFETARLSADVVCAGDSITGWNNFGVVGDWPYRTYPEFLQGLCEPLGLTIANGGIAGEISENGSGRSGTTWACSRTPGTSWSATARTTSGCGPLSSGPAP